MKSPELLKNLPTPAQIVLRPMLLISLVLHGIVLILPVPSTWETSEPEEQVKVTQLPSLSPSPKSSVNSAEEPKAKTSPTPRQPTPFLSASPSQSAINPFRYPIQPTPNVSPSIEPSPSISVAPKPSPSSSRNETQTTEEKNTDSTIDDGRDTNDENVQDPLKKFLENFPFPEGAAVGSLGRLSGDADRDARHVQQPLSQVIRYYDQELPARNYTLANPSTDDSDFKVYQVSLDKVSRYLHLIFNGENTVIFLSETQLNRADLLELAVETAEERELKETVEQIIIAGKYENELSEGVKEKLSGGKYNHLGTVYEKATEQLGTQIESKLKEKGFKIPQVFPLGEDGIIYSVEKNDFQGFIQLIPTQDKSGTAVISLDDFSF